MKIEPTSATLGALVTDVDLRHISDSEFAQIEAAWHEHAVLAFRGQNLDDESHIVFSRRFGTLERLVAESIEGANPEIFLASNLRPDGTLDEPGGNRARFQQGNQYWHSDSSFKRITAKASLLRSVVIPSSGGETAFADMRAAYDALEPSRQEWLADKAAVHSYAYSQGMVGGLDVMSQEELDAVPPVPHPVVRVHPDTGRKSLFIGRHASHIVGEDLESSRTLLQELCAEACQPPRVYEHPWAVGDLVIWDNRCVLHRGRPWSVSEARDMHRTTVAGEDDADNEWNLSSDAAE